MYPGLQMQVPVLRLHVPLPLQFEGQTLGGGEGGAGSATHCEHTTKDPPAVIPMTSGCKSAEAEIGGSTNVPSDAATTLTDIDQDPEVSLR
jgi:hypothetical protein